MANPKGNPDAVRPYQWKPGQSGNPAGRPKGGAVINEWLDILINANDYTLQSIIVDPSEPRAKRLAAHQLITADTRPIKYAATEDADGNTVLLPVGELREPGMAFDRIMDRTVGKPAQTILTGTAPARTIEDAMADLDRLLAENPEVRAALADKLAAIIPVDTVARALPEGAGADDGQEEQSGGHAGQDGGGEASE